MKRRSKKNIQKYTNMFGEISLQTLHEINFDFWVQKVPDFAVCGVKFSGFSVQNLFMLKLWKATWVKRYFWILQNWKNINQNVTMEMLTW